VSLKGPILVVDEDPSVAAKLTLELGATGVAVQAVVTLGRAREVCRDQTVAGIVAEYRHPDGEVPGFCEWLRRDGGVNRGSPVLVRSR